MGIQDRDYWRKRVDQLAGGKPQRDAWARQHEKLYAKSVPLARPRRPGRALVWRWVAVAAVLCLVALALCYGMRKG